VFHGLFRRQFSNTHNHSHRFFHAFKRYKFMFTVEIITTGKDIRARQATERKLCAVCTAADRLHDRLDIAVFHRLLRQRNNVRMLRHFIAHVVIVVVQRHFDITLTMQDLTHHMGDINDFLLAGFKLHFIEVADNVVHFRALYVSLDRRQVIETFITLGVFRRFPNR